MAPLKDIARVVNGLSMVAKEAINRSQSASLESVIKAAVLSAADVAGLTKGKLRSFESQTLNIDNMNHAALENTGSSIVYFTDESPHDISAPVSDTPQTLDADASVPLSAPSASADPDLQTSSDQGPRTDIPSTSNAAVVDGTVISRHQRKPRERRVPSSPFSRAIG